MAKQLEEKDFFETLLSRKFVGKKDKEELNKFLDRAYDIRKTELDLYWKRATYFWGFLIATFTAYFIVLDTSKVKDERYQLLIICIGFIFSLAWYLVNKGSTYWLTHWERMIDTIETRLGTGFYKINLQENSNEKLVAYHPYSVSRINIAVSLFISVVWFLLMVNFIYNNIVKYFETKGNNCITDIVIDWKIIIILTLTSIVTRFLILKTKSGKGDAEGHSFYERTSFYKSF